MADLGVLSVALLVYALVSQRLERSFVTAPMVFVAAGIVVGPSVLGLVGTGLPSGAGLVLAELALALILFSDSARIDLAVFRSRRNLPIRLLGLGMPLTIALGVAFGAVLLTGIEFWEAAIVAAVLAPTDAALGRAVIENESVPLRIRHALDVESGLNDGLSVPFLALFVALAVEEAEPSAGSWLSFAAEQIGFGVLLGAAVGAAGAWLVERTTRRESMGAAAQSIAVLALAVIAYAAADAVGGNGFIAAFVGGLAAGRISRVAGASLFDFLEEEGRLLSFAVFFIFGVAAIDLLDGLSWGIAAYAALSLTLIRMLPVGISLRGSGLGVRSAAFIGWFGPRGLASIVLALTVAEEQPELPGLSVVLAATTLTVLASVVLHGVSAKPVAAAYAASKPTRPTRE